MFAQNLIAAPTAGSNSYVSQIVSTPTGPTFFNAIDKRYHGTNLWALYSTDGTITERLTLNDGAYNSGDATMLTPLGNNKIVFAAANFDGWGEIWVTDGTQSGTHILEKFVNSNVTKPAILGMVSLGNTVLYGVYTNDNHLQLRKTDGTKAGSVLVYDFGVKSKSLLAVLKNINGIIYFDLYDIDNGGNDIIWRSDGTSKGTYALRNLGTGNSGYGLTSYIMPAGSNIYFTASNWSNGNITLFKTDGTPAGTVPVKEISVGFNSNSYPSFAAIGSTLYFSKMME